MASSVASPNKVVEETKRTLQEKMSIVQNLYRRYEISKHTLSQCQRVIMDCNIPKLEEGFRQKVRHMLQGLVHVLQGLRTAGEKITVSSVAKIVRMAALTYFLLGNYKACLARLEAMAFFWPNTSSDQLEDPTDLHTHAMDQYVWGCACLKLELFEKCKAPLMRSLRVWLVKLRSPATRPELIYVRMALGRACTFTKDPKKSIGYFNCSRTGLALRKDRGLDANKTSAAVRATNNLYLADAYHMCGRHAEALPWYWRSLNTNKGKGDPLDFFLLVVGTRKTLVQRLYGFLTRAVESASQTGDVDKLVYFNRKLVVICTHEGMWDGSLSVEIDQVLEEAALSLDKHHQHVEASELFLQTIDYRSRRAGRNHQDMALAHHNLAVTYESIGRVGKEGRRGKGQGKEAYLRKALVSYEEAFRIEQIHFPPDNDNIIESKENLYEVLHKLKQYDRAIGYMKEVIAFVEATPPSPDRHMKLARRCQKLGRSLGARGDKWAAIGAHVRALEHERAWHSASGTAVGSFRDNESFILEELAELCVEVKDYRHIIQHCREGIARFDLAQTTQRPDRLLNFLVMEGNAHHRMATMDKKKVGPELLAESGMARHYKDFVQHHVRCLVHCFVRSLKINEREGDPRDIARAHYELSVTYREVNNKEKAQEHMMIADAMVRSIPGGEQMPFVSGMRKNMRNLNHINVIVHGEDPDGFQGDGGGERSTPLVLEDGAYRRLVQLVGADDSLRASCVVGTKGAVGWVREGLRDANGQGGVQFVATPHRAALRDMLEAFQSKAENVPEPTATQAEFYRSKTEDYTQLIQALSQYGDTSVHFCRIKTRLMHAPPSSTSVVVQTPSVGRH